jgi:hypothetical protein
MPVDARPVVEAERAVLDEQVAVRRRDMDPPTLRLHAVLRLHRRQRAGPGQDLGKDARPVRRHVQDDADCCGELGGQLRDELAQRFDPAGGCAEDDGVDPAVLGLRHGPPIYPSPEIVRPTA